MQLHDIQPINKNKSKKRVGRGGKRGTYSGRGVKGQKSRAGRKLQPSMRELFKRFPKLRGYRQILKSSPQTAITLRDLEINFEEGDKVSPAVLLAKGVLGQKKGKVPQVKIVVQGGLSKKLTIENCCLSKGAKEAVEKAGGTIK